MTTQVINILKNYDLFVVRLLYKIFRGDKINQFKTNVNFCAPYNARLCIKRGVGGGTTLYTLI